MHLVGFIIRIYHDTRSSERQNGQLLKYRDLKLFVLLKVTIDGFILIIINKKLTLKMTGIPAETCW